MRLLLLLFSIPFFGFSQSKISLEFGKEFRKTDEIKTEGFYEYDMAVKSKSSTDVDYYSFVLNVDGAKTFEENGIEASPAKVLTFDDVSKLSSCELHDLLSKTPMIYLVRKESNGIYKQWIAVYQGTYRNIVKTKASKL